MFGARLDVGNPRVRPVRGEGAALHVRGHAHRGDGGCGLAGDDDQRAGLGWSGHFMPSAGSLQIGIDAFSRFGIQF